MEKSEFLISNKIDKFKCLYNEKEKKIQIVESNNENNVYDSFYPEDVIGADLEIKFHCADVGKDDDIVELLSKFPDLEERKEELSDGHLTEEKPTATAFLNIYCYPKEAASRSYMPRFSSSGIRKSNHRYLKLVPCFDFANARATVCAIRKLAKLGHFEGLKPSKEPFQYLIILNPFSGSGMGYDIYSKTLCPMLDQAGIDHRLLQTEHSGHARERMSIRESSKDGDKGLIHMEQIDVSDFNGIICVGGDGILSEILQGIWERPDALKLLSRINFGVVPAGTCNGLVRVFCMDLMIITAS